MSDRLPAARKKIDLTARLEKINANRAKFKQNIDRRASRRQSVSYEFAKLVRETTRAIKTEMKIDQDGNEIRKATGVGMSIGSPTGETPEWKRKAFVGLPVAQAHEYSKSPVFSEQAAIERRSFDLEMALDDLIAAHNATPAYVAMNYLELASAKTKLDFLLSAIRPAAAAE